MSLVKLIHEIIDKQVPVQVFPAKVLSVDESNMSCVVEPYYGSEREDVRLRSALANGDDSGMIAIPKEGSYVLVGIIHNLKEQCFVVATSELEKLHLKVGQTSMEVDEDGYKIERNGINLKDVSGSLIDAITQITVPTGVGPSGVPVNAPVFLSLKEQLNQILK